MHLKSWFYCIKYYLLSLINSGFEYLIDEMFQGLTWGDGSHGIPVRSEEGSGNHSGRSSPAKKRMSTGNQCYSVIFGESKGFRMTWSWIMQNQSQATGRGVPIRRTPELTESWKDVFDNWNYDCLWSWYLGLWIGCLGWWIWHLVPTRRTPKLSKSWKEF